jgi:putative Mg2+ transporter-C (MgtC) family protein
MLSVAHQLSAAALPSGEGWRQAAELGVALLLSATIGLEREIRQKSAGLRTHTLVGVGAALFMLVSKYGFMDVLVPGRIVLDPSRVAAQVVSGIGFLGAGLIFVRRDAVRGLTTAAGVWITAAVGMAAGAGLPVLAALATGVYLLVAGVFPALTRFLPRSGTAVSVVRVRYPDGRGILRRAADRDRPRLRGERAVGERSAARRGNSPGRGRRGDRGSDPAGARPGVGQRAGRGAHRDPRRARGHRGRRERDRLAGGVPEGR